MYAGLTNKNMIFERPDDSQKWFVSTFLFVNIRISFAHPISLWVYNSYLLASGFRTVFLAKLHTTSLALLKIFICLPSLRLRYIIYLHFPQPAKCSTVSETEVQVDFISLPCWLIYSFNFVPACSADECICSWLYDWCCVTVSYLMSLGCCFWCYIQWSTASRDRNMESYTSCAACYNRFRNGPDMKALKK